MGARSHRSRWGSNGLRASPGSPPSGAEGAVLGGPAGGQPARGDEAAQNFRRESQVWKRRSKRLPAVRAAGEHGAPQTE